MAGFHKIIFAAHLAVYWALIAPCSADGKKVDAFLDRHFPADIQLDTYSAPPAEGKGPDIEYNGVKVSSFESGVLLLEQLSGKKVILPEGISQWLKAHDDEKWGITLGVEKDQKVRDFFERLCLKLSVLWKYDLQQDALLLTFTWERSDPRSANELAFIVAQEKPVRWTDLPMDPQPNGVGGYGQTLDRWRTAFDALLCKPENFRSAGTVRLYYENHMNSIMHFPVINLFAGTVHDPQGHRDILILNGRERMTNKDSPGDISYYIFNGEGRFLRGGVYSMGDRYGGEVVSAKADSENEVTIDVGWGTFAMNPTHVHFQVVDDDLILESSTDHSGKNMSAAETQTSVPMPGFGTGLLRYTIANTP